MIETDSGAIRERCKDTDAAFAVYFYTPMCGTCGVAEKMLGVIEAATSALPLYKCDINFAPDLAREWRIESVPCLMLIEQGACSRKVYAMRSVPDLYDVLKPLMTK
ncbi:thioredoxin family protein [Aneurinibacillus aneurinilyticus]|jgi:thioredoxin-like negative regulator of GroEL|uniref:Thioredoxin family protein n=2 Tax=Aneurinibacillus aneurinilyticus TaxID=1391 RepID=A0A848D1T5_ANEAE|nr:thioredoxin family protein [Aneurinibacillus aneurinilyticus]ERI08533.1 hypothetical protein HMPREF0083_03378 [Aneurinibacillus aneurinilyticus ATCC 12856]MCI1693207.1 thioredoxin family protein [Aneurinibacillus aneurinilyticus]MED0704993.1 thioredoxin family protein [Aneurinibacillus aneurinilyticus]MED0721794.1 thioredoxin family protein [Aneurinibacillus aneurinilyticus]MED0732748.1 thioredoxin family protein [Aneurinibacillus aneurinilyticus]